MNLRVLSAFLFFFVLFVLNSSLVNAASVFVGAGDIANSKSGAETTAKLIEGVIAENPDALVFTTGDNVYPSGAYKGYLNLYDPTWGRFKSKTRPTPGNHDFKTPLSNGYFRYFCPPNGTCVFPTGTQSLHYSFDLGDWHIISLNSHGDSQRAAAVAWLQDDLANNQKECTLAYWHHPLFSSGSHGNNIKMKPFWDVLYAAGADVVINGHDHNYERFAQMNPAGQLDSASGIRQFVIGTGGSNTRPFKKLISGSESRITNVKGVLKLTLDAQSYSWEFIPQEGATVTDTGSGNCVTSAGQSPATPVVMPSGSENLAPSVNAGSDITTAVGVTVKLAGEATDDGVPNDTLGINWEVDSASDANSANIVSPAQLSTDASFLQAGIYTLKLNVNDGALTSSDTLQVTVLPQGGSVPEQASDIDISGDNVVDNTDYQLMVSNFGLGGCDNPADINNDCKTDIRDFNILYSHLTKVSNENNN